jgi:membrane protein DedA with SNARE-associated domain
MTFDSFIAEVLAFTREHAVWAPAIAFLVAFGESFAFISLLIPGWAMLIGMGAFIGAGGLDLWPTWLGTTAGASIGDWISYLIGYHFKHGATRIWPLSGHPQVVLRGHAFFRRWAFGALSLAGSLAPCGRWYP